MSHSRSRFRYLQLNEIIDELEHGEVESEIPDRIHILPPESANGGELTDEDSGDENLVLLHNLPGRQLRAAAEVAFDKSSSEESEEEDLPLAQLSKRYRRSCSNKDGACSLPGPSTSMVTIPSIPSTSFSRPLVSKTKDYKWRNRDIHPQHKEWIDKEGPVNQQNPMYYFDLFFNDELVNLFVQYTNLYALQKNKAANVTFSEIKCFFGVLLLSGYVVLPRRSMYWENAADCGIPIVYNAISRDRFSFIMANLHCCDNTNLIPGDKFAKVRPLFDIINTDFLKYAPFEENYSIDEAMVPYYGGHSCKQFIRGKPIRWGYKFWVGATRLGYILWFEPYQGQSGEIPSEYKKLGLGASVILQFADVLRKIDSNAPFHLYFDNFFTSIPLLDELGERGFKATGTARENRLSKCKLPPNKDLQKTDRGTYKYQSTMSANILVCKWHDNSVVTVASNAVSALPTSKVKRFSQQQKKFVNVDQPATIKHYNENMGGVDRADQNIGLYRTSIRGKKWYFSLISHCLDMITHNAWQLYKLDGGEYDHLKFRRSIATGLLETYKKQEARKPGRTSQGLHEHSRYDGRDHIIRYRADQLRCAYCHKNANFFCIKCKVTLHPKFCYESYHTPQ